MTIFLQTNPCECSLFSQEPIRPLAPPPPPPRPVGVPLLGSEEQREDRVKLFMELLMAKSRLSREPQPHVFVRDITNRADEKESKPLWTYIPYDLFTIHFPTGQIIPRHLTEKLIYIYKYGDQKNEFTILDNPRFLEDGFIDLSPYCFGTSNSSSGQQ